MAFVEGTKIYTDRGWKKIEDISGYDKVFVRNFVGDAEFIQPFAIKKKKYDGEIVKISAMKWFFDVTLDHIVVYDRGDPKRDPKFIRSKAEDIKAKPYIRFYRKFRYIHPNEYKKETIIIHDKYSKRWISVSNEDWFKFVGFILCRVNYYPITKRKNAIKIRLEWDRKDQETIEIGSILNRMQLRWKRIDNEDYKISSIIVSSKNTLASRLEARLGSTKRKQMFLPRNMIYNCDKELADILIQTIINATKREETDIKNVYQFSSNNLKLIDSLVTLGTLWGYNVSKSLVTKKGHRNGIRIVSKDIYRIAIGKPSDTYSPTKVEKYKYKGYVYEIDIFDGQVYTLGSTSPIWINPR